MFVQKSLSLKKHFERKNSQTRFCCLCVNLRTVKFGEQSVKFPMSFGSLQYPLRVNENSSKCVNQTGDFYFRPKLKTAISLPIFVLFQWFLFLYQRFHLDHYLNRKIEIWRKLLIWRYAVTLTVWTKSSIQWLCVAFTNLHFERQSSAVRVLRGTCTCFPRGSKRKKARENFSGTWSYQES